MPNTVPSKGKSTRTLQRVHKKMGMSRPVGRPAAALDSDFEDMYVKVKMRRMTKQEAADALSCSVRTLERKFKQIKDAQHNVLASAQRETRARPQ